MDSEVKRWRDILVSIVLTHSQKSDLDAEIYSLAKIVLSMPPSQFLVFH